jgi:PIN domain nuclease of toxin-antitoxin system
VKLLLDTHAFLWFIHADPRLGLNARAAIENPRNIKYVSKVSLREIAIKNSANQLNLRLRLDALFPAEINRHGFVLLPIEPSHLSLSRGLAFHHHDPFARLLVAQAMIEQLTLVTQELESAPYPIRRIW